MYDLDAINQIYSLPLPDLLFRAQQVHREHHDPRAIQLCTLQSIKTGGCPEDCKYCPQSAHYNTPVEAESLMNVPAIVSAAQTAREGGASRFCMGAAWREVRDGAQFDSVLAAVRGVSALGMEVCCTLGLLSDAQAVRLKDAGCSVYNHNLDTSRDYYPEIITTRTYDDRLRTLSRVRSAGLQVCSGGILGMGEAVEDRLKLLGELASLEPQPESVPINALVPVEGTPLGDTPPVDPIEFVRIIATARILMPRAMVRLSAGRTSMSAELQALCFVAGANSIFLGEKLLTTPNPERSEDMELLHRLGMKPLAAQGAANGALGMTQAAALTFNAQRLTLNAQVQTRQGSQEETDPPSLQRSYGATRTTEDGGDGKEPGARSQEAGEDLITKYQVPTANLPTTNYQSPTTNHQLPTTRR